MAERRANTAVAAGLAVLAGLFQGACFAPVGAWPLAFVAVAPLVVAVRGRRGPAAAALGWVAGTVAASLAVTPWIAAATRDYFAQGGAGAVLFASLVGQALSALPSALFAVAAARLGRLGTAPARVLATAGAWTGLELVRARAFTGAPWDLLAHALYAHPLWIQTAELGGAFAVSFVLAASGAALADAVLAPSRAALATAAALVAATGLYGAARLAGLDDGADPAVRVGLVQGNIPNAWRVDAARADDAFQAFAETTRRVTAARPDLVVWPENAVSFLLAPNPRFNQAIRDLLGPGGPLLLLGGPRYGSAGDGRVEFFNSVHLLSATGTPLGFYDKRRLVPFAEYAALSGVPGLGWRFDAPGSYTPGTRATIFTAPDRFGVLICFEAIYPDLARDLVRAGARFLVNVSNDAWFGNSAGLEQHFAMTVFRAVETRRALVRATNTGVTAVVAPSGRVAARFPSQVRDAWVVRVPLRDGATPYDAAGDAFAIVAALGALVGLVRARAA